MPRVAKSLPKGSTAANEGEKTHRSVDLLGRVYEYFLTRLASTEGKNGGQFYTPSCVVRCLVEMLAPYKGRIYDHACGSGDISIYGQESNVTTRRLAIMNLAIRGIEADIGKEHADTFRSVQHPDLRADYVLATAERDSAFSKTKPHRRACRRQDNPMPFNDSDTALRGSAFLQSEAKMQVVSEAKDNFRKDEDVRWQFGVPPKGNANFA